MVSSPKTGDIVVGRLIARRREDLGLSRKALAEITGLSYPYIAQIETGYRMPSSRHHGPLARALGLSLDELFGASGTGDGPLTDARVIDDPTADRPSSRTGSTVDSAVYTAVAALAQLPTSVRLEALSQVQLRVVTGVAQEQARGM